jgi:hypothetical protein
MVGVVYDKGVQHRHMCESLPAIAQGVVCGQLRGNDGKSTLLPPTRESATV